jgi:hypothetical protein
VPELVLVVVVVVVEVVEEVEMNTSSWPLVLCTPNSFPRLY